MVLPWTIRVPLHGSETCTATDLSERLRQPSPLDGGWPY